MSKKKEINIIFIALREEFPGHKDIDHLLPFLYFLNKSNDFKFTARLIILENESKDMLEKFFITRRNLN